MPSTHQAWTLWDHSSHRTPYFLTLPKLLHLLDAPPQPTARPPHIHGQPRMRTKHACAICVEYRHYTHHCPDFPRYRNTLFSSPQAHVPMSPNDSKDTLKEFIYYISVIPRGTFGLSKESSPIPAQPRATTGYLALRPSNQPRPSTPEPLLQIGTSITSSSTGLGPQDKTKK